MRRISMGLACLLAALLFSASDAHAEKLQPGDKAKVEAQAMSKAKVIAQSKVRKGSPRGDAAYEDCYDTCVSETECKHSDYEWIPSDVWDDVAYGYCLAAWAAGCADGCSGLKP